MIAIGALPRHWRERSSSPDCLVYGDLALTWAELDDLSTRLAWGLKRSGVVQDDFVTMMLPNCSMFHVVAFAIWKLGATPHVAAAGLTSLELETLLATVRPRLLVAEAGALATRFGAATPEGLLASGKDDPLEIKVARYWKATNSGGSTGRPKVIVDHKPAAFDLDRVYMRLPSASSTLHLGPLHHSAPFSFIHFALFRGNRAVGLARFDALEVLKLLEHYEISWTMMVPTMMHRIWRLPAAVREAHDLTKLQTLWHAAGPISPALKRNWIEWLGPQRVWETYAASENMAATVISGADWLDHPGSVGRPTTEGQIKVLDENGRVAAPGEVGEIYFMPATGPGTTYHYLGADRREAAGGWETVGDYGWMDSNGYLYLADRRVDMIVSGGVNVYPAEVEGALLSHPAVEAAVVIGLPDEDLGSRVHAIVKLDVASQGSATDEALTSFLTTQLARYKLPRTFEYVDRLLRDEFGKVSRAELRRLRLQTPETTPAGGDSTGADAERIVQE